jgi:hypothetical protein
MLINRERNDTAAVNAYWYGQRREANIAEWRRRIAEHVEAGDHETAANIRRFLEAGYD